MEIEKFACINAIALITIFPMGIMATPLLGLILMFTFAKILKILNKRLQLTESIVYSDCYLLVGISNDDIRKICTHNGTERFTTTNYRLLFSNITNNFITLFFLV